MELCKICVHCLECAAIEAPTEDTSIDLHCDRTDKHAAQTEKAGIGKCPNGLPCRLKWRWKIRLPYQR